MPLQLLIPGQRTAAAFQRRWPSYPWKSEAEPDQPGLVVTRYFGGIDSAPAALIRPHSHTTLEAADIAVYALHVWRNLSGQHDGALRPRPRHHYRQDFDVTHCCGVRKRQRLPRPPTLTSTTSGPAENHVDQYRG